MWKTLLALGLLAGPAAAQIPGLTLTPVPIPTPRTVNPYRIGLGSNGRIWFTDVTFLPRQVGFIASNGAITAFKLVDSADPNNEVRPLAITEGPDGNGWFTISVTNSSGSPLRTEIGRVTPTGVITRFPTPTVDACRVFGRNPVCDITVGPDGNLWFTETQMKRIGKITLTGQITEYLADGAGGEFFYGITAGPDGNLWVADSGDIIRITTAGSITFFDRQGLVPIEITAGPDGNVWFTDRASDSIGRITPTGVITLFPTLSPTSDPEGIARGSDGKLYFTEVSARKIGQIDPATGVINESAVTELGVPSGEAPFDIVSRVGINKTGSAGIGDIIGDMVINAANAAADYSVYVAKLTTPPAPNLTISKTAEDFRHERSVARRGDTILFSVKVKNDGNAPVTMNWFIRESPGEGLEDCKLRFPGVFADFFSTTELVGGQDVLTIFPRDPSLIGRDAPTDPTLPPGATKEFWIECLVVGAGAKSNSVVLFGGGSGSRSSSVTIETFEPRFPSFLPPTTDDDYIYDPALAGRR